MSLSFGRGISIPPLNAAGNTDLGASRPNNEDAWVAMPEIGFFAIADGMGGHNAGEVAAKSAIDFLSSIVGRLHAKQPLQMIAEMRNAIEQTNLHIQKLGALHPKYRGMGTTLCCLLWTKSAIIYAHVGDSRVYLLRKQKLTVLTQDHSLHTKWLATRQESSHPYPYKHVITRSLGGQGKANPEIATIDYQEGDLFFLCTDGLSDVLRLEEMESICIAAQHADQIALDLIALAKMKGGADNMTVVIAQCIST